jgi:hypothetical protein
MFANKVRAYAPFRCSTLGLAPGLTHKHYTRLERHAKDLTLKAYYEHCKYKKYFLFTFCPQLKPGNLWLFVNTCKILILKCRRISRSIWILLPWIMIGPVLEFFPMMQCCKHDTKHNDTQHNDSQYNDTQHTCTKYRILLCRGSFMLSVIYFERRILVLYAECCYAECCFAECCYVEWRQCVCHW